MSSFNKDLLNITECYLPPENAESSTNLLGGIEKATLPASERQVPTLRSHVLDRAVLPHSLALGYAPPVQTTLLPCS